jgi:hypothetical protein
MAMKSDEKSRNSDVCGEPVDRLLTPIRGYEDKPLLPVAEAIEPVADCFDDIQDYVYVALVLFTFSRNLFMTTLYLNNMHKSSIDLFNVIICCVLDEKKSD